MSIDSNFPDSLLQVCVRLQLIDNFFGLNLAFFMKSGILENLISFYMSSLPFPSEESVFFFDFLDAFALGSAFLVGFFLVEPLGLPRPFLAIGFESSLSGSALRFCKEIKRLMCHHQRPFNKLPGHSRTSHSFQLLNGLVPSSRE